MQACARIGATHSVVFGGFSAKSLQERIIDAGAVAVITADGQMRGGKEIAAEAGVRRGARHGRLRERQERDRLQAHRQRRRHGSAARQVVARGGARAEPTTASPTWVNAEHPLFILYTSGSTGKPKGVQHSTGGYLLQAMLTMKWTFDYKPTDVFWCTADVGWVTGHTYIAYGPLAVGATEIMFEGVPTYPDAGPLLEDDPGPQGHGVLHRADGDPLAHQGGRRPCPKKYDLSVAAHPRHGGRADQSRSVDVVPRDRGRRPLPDRRHLVADRNRRPHDHAAARRHAAQARLVHVAAARHHRGHRRRDRPRRSARARAASWSSSARGRR